MTSSGRSSQREVNPPDEARAWLVLLYAGRPTAVDRLRFEAWLDRSPDHRSAFLRAEEAWSLLGQSAQIEDWVHEPVTVTRTERRPRRPIWPVLAGAAAMAASVLLLVAPPLAERFGPSDPDLYASGIGQVKTVQLDDGTLLTLGASSAVSVVYSGQSRSIDLLRGSAYFDVAHDIERPMVVDAAGSEIRVLGTAFAVRLGPNDVTVNVARGRISVGRDVSDDPDLHSTRVTIAAGKTLVADQQGRIQSINDADLGTALAWIEGRLEYDGTNLADVVADINRYRAKKLEITGPRLERLQVTASFSADQAERFVSGLPAAYGVEIHEFPDRTVIREESQ